MPIRHAPLVIENDSENMKSSLGLLGACLMALGLLVAFFGAVAAIDPVGLQMSNDADPFGVPPPFWQFALVITIGACAFLAGCWLYWREIRGR